MLLTQRIMQDGDTPSHCTSDPLLAKSGALCAQSARLAYESPFPLIFDSQKKQVRAICQNGLA